MKEIFIECIHGMTKARISYFSKKDQTSTTRIVAPIDISKSRDEGSVELFRFYDFKGGLNGHITPKKLEDIFSLEKLNETFQ